MACTLEETVTTRAGALCFSRSRSRLVSRNGARWLSANVRSRPSAVTCRVFQYPPALLISTSIRGSALEHLVSQPPHLRLGGQIRDEHVHLPAAGRADLASRGLGAPAVPAGDRQVRAERGQAQRGGLSDAAGTAGDQHGPAGHRLAAALFQVGHALMVAWRTCARLCTLTVT